MLVGLRNVLVILLPCILLFPECAEVSLVGKEPIPTRIVLNTLEVKKEPFLENKSQIMEKKSMWIDYMEKAEGHLRHADTQVSLTTIPDFPDSYVECLEGDKLLWKQSTKGWPSNRITCMFIHEGVQESLIFLLLDNGPGSIVVLGEDGHLRRVITLHPTGEASGKRFNSFSTLSLREQLYVIAFSYDKVVAVFDLNGDMTTSLPTAGIPAWGIGLTWQRNSKDNLIVIFVNHWTTSHSSTLFMLSETWQRLYEEVLGTGEWIGKTRGKLGEDLIVSIESIKTDCKEKVWRYYLQ